MRTISPRRGGSPNYGLPGSPELEPAFRLHRGAPLFFCPSHLILGRFTLVRVAPATGQ
jgi:hypothetical protein